MTSSSRITGIAELYTAMSYDESRDSFPASKNWLAGKDPLKCFYDGKLALIPEDGKYKTQAQRDPCTDFYLVSVVVPTVEDIKIALQSSSNGEKSWNSTNQHSRGKHISSIAKKCEELREVLAEVEAVTVGVSLSHAKSEISRVAAYFYYYAASAHTIKKKISEPENGVLLLRYLKPAPIIALAAIVAPALAAGHAVVINPPSEASLTSFVFADLCSKAGLPPGVVNVIPGSLDIAKAAIKEHVEKVVLWGSESSCRNVCNNMVDISRPVIPFYYGKSISIIFDSADHLSAVDVLLKNMSFSYQQMPWSVRTILVEESAFPTFLTMLKKKFISQKAGIARDHGIDIGLPKKCDTDSLTFLKDALNHFLQRGIEIVQIPVADFLFFPPTLIIGTDAEMNSIVKNYDIMPFVSVLPFRNTKEALEFANKSHFGVAASVWTSCLSLAMYTAANLQVGTVWINDHGLLDPSVPFSSRKKGFGCIGSQKGLLQFLSFENTENVSAHDTNANRSAATSQTQKEYFPHYGGAFKQTVNAANFSVSSSSGSSFLVHECARNDVQKAVDAAQSAQQKWWKLSSTSRAALLLQVADEFQEKCSDFLKFSQKPVSNSEKELENTVNNLYYWASRCHNMMSLRSDCPVPNYMVQNLQDPVGVIGIVLEDPSELEAFALAVISAISFGNSVVVILNNKNPVLALEFCTLLTNKKVPPGLVNVLPSSECTLYSELFHKDVELVWYSSNDKVSVDTLHKMANKVMKFLWKFPTHISNLLEFEYASSYTKAIWIPSESASC